MTRFRRVRLAHVAPSFPPCDRGREASERSGLVRELSPRFAGRWPSGLGTSLWISYTLVRFQLSLP